MSNNDFLAKAQAATQRVAASAATQQNATPQQAKIVEELAQDRPTIHAAVTSFLSVVAARSLVTPDVAQQQHQPHHQLVVADPLVLSNAEALKCSRALLKAINATTLCATMPTTTTKSLSSSAATDKNKQAEEEEYNLVAQLWNGLIASEQKPARYLGRRAMKHAWGDVKPTITTTNEDEKLLRFVDEFERLLFFGDDENPDMDNDAALIWSNDGGKAELQKRRERREKRAKEASSQSTEESPAEEEKLPLIEELSEDNNEAVSPE